MDTMRLLAHEVRLADVLARNGWEPINHTGSRAMRLVAQTQSRSQHIQAPSDHFAILYLVGLVAHAGEGDTRMWDRTIPFHHYHGFHARMNSDLGVRVTIYLRLVDMVLRRTPQCSLTSL